MSGYVVRRLAQGVLVVWGAATVVFALLFLTGDPTLLMVEPGMSAGDVARIRHSLGYDRPWFVQYVDYLRKAARGDFGLSLRHRQPAFALVLGRMPATMQLAAAALSLSVLVGIPAGVMAAARRRSVSSQVVLLGAILGQAIPTFWLGLVLMYFFAVELRWLPISGRGTLRHLILPAITLGAYSMALNTRLVRSSVLEALGQDFITTARAKGLSERVVLFHHALRNALIPLVTVVGMDVGTLLGGAVITEHIFAWPGVGSLTLDAVYGRDFPLVVAAVTMLAVVFVTATLLTDLLYGYLDPRIRYA